MKRRYFYKSSELLGNLLPSSSLIYIAKGGYLIGKQMEEVFQVPMIGVSTVRDGNGMKEKNWTSCRCTSKLYSKPIDFD